MALIAGVFFWAGGFLIIFHVTLYLVFKKNQCWNELFQMFRMFVMLVAGSLYTS